MKLNLETNVVSIIVPEDQRDAFSADWQDAVNAYSANPEGPRPTITLKINMDQEVPLYIEDGQLFLNVTDIEFVATPATEE